PPGDDIHCSRSKRAWNSCAETSSSPDRCPEQRRGSQRTRESEAKLCGAQTLLSATCSAFCLLPSALLRCRIVARRWFLLPDIRRMAIRTLAGLLVLGELFF